MKSILQPFHSLILLASLTAFAGCSDGPTEPLENFGKPEGVVVTDLDSGALYAETGIAIGVSGESIVFWTGELPSMVPGQKLRLHAEFLNEDGEEMPLGGSYRLRVRIADDRLLVVAPDNHGDRADLDGIAAGVTAIVFELIRGDALIWISPPISVTVV